jgi:hypothetical protein
MGAVTQRAANSEKAGDIYHIKVDVPAGTSRENAGQVANRVAIELERSRRRNG